MKNIIGVCLIALTGLSANAKIHSNISSAEGSKMQNHSVKDDKIRIGVGSSRFTVTLLDNESAKGFKDMFPLTIRMTDLNGNEKYYDSPKALPTNASSPNTIKAGDIMLYGSNTLVLFYKSFSTSYSYTRLGQVNDPS